MAIENLIILLGPYRNISTLTSSVLSLHPDVQVLNHAMDRLFTDEGLDFLSCRTQASLDAFIAAALDASGGGQMGTHGGSILFSHAYADAPEMKATYERRYGDVMVKPSATHLLWKESMRVQSRLMAEDGSLDEMIGRFPNVHLLLPVRHPLFCALSNHRPYYLKTLGLLVDATIEQTLERIFQVLQWGLEKADRYPAAVMVFTQNDARPELFHRWCRFFDLPADPAWLSDAEAHFHIREKPEPSADLVALTRTLAADYLGAWPDIIEALELGTG